MAACKDQTPTLTGDQFFPGGSRPVTLEAILPAAQYLQTVGEFTGFESPTTYPELIVANQFGGALSSHALEKFPIPKSVSFSVNGVSTTDTLYSIRQARLVVTVDTLGSSLAAPTTLQAFAITQAYDWASATWTLAVDSGGVQTPWTTPGGTHGPLLAQATYTPHAAGDSVLLPIDTTQLKLLRPDSVPLLIGTAPAGTRLQLRGTVLRLDVKPSNAGKDTTITVDVNPAANNPTQRTFVFTPQPPAAGGNWQAGGVLADRTVFSVNLNQQLPGCAPADQPCATVSLKDVRLNRISLLLRPLPVPLGFQALQTVPLEIWRVTEPALGRRAPLVPSRITGGPVLDSARVTQAPADTLVELPFTLETQLMVQSDTTQLSFALLGEATTAGASTTSRTFGLVRYDPLPRLRIVYTLPTRPALP